MKDTAWQKKKPSQRSRSVVRVDPVEESCMREKGKSKALGCEGLGLVGPVAECGEASLSEEQKGFWAVKGTE